VTEFLNFVIKEELVQMTLKSLLDYQRGTSSDDFEELVGFVSVR